MRLRRVALAVTFIGLSIGGLGAGLTSAPALAQAPGGPPPAVGTVRAAMRAVTETSEYVGRIQAVDRVDLVARVTAFIEQRLFTEGAEVNKGDILYKLERGPFEADVQAKTAAVAQARALLRNASLTLGRASSLLNTPAGQRSTVDDATATQTSQAALVASAEANLRASQISLDYTEIKAPVAGKITRTALTIGNVVTPASGPLATIVSQDPMYVVFPVSNRAAIDLAGRYADKGGLDAVKIRVRLPDGSLYGQVGKLGYVDPTVSASTDTLIFRATIANPLRAGAQPGQVGNRVLVDGEFITALLEGVQPIQALAIPRSAVLSDQQGNFVYVVDAASKAQPRRITLGQSTAATAIVMSGLTVGETVIVDGIQSIHPGAAVSPAPAAAGPTDPGSSPEAPAAKPAGN